MTEQTIGERIRDRMKVLGYKQKDLAEKVGLTNVTLSRYIHNHRTPKGMTLIALASALHTTPNELLGIEEKTDFEADLMRLHRLIARNADKLTKKQKLEIIEALFEE